MSVTTQHLQSIFDTLYNDIDKCLVHTLLLAEHISDDDKQFWRRVYIRSLFAFIEGVVYNMKQVALEALEDCKANLTNGEEAILQEKNYNLDDTGAIKPIDTRLSIRRNIKFAFTILAKSSGQYYSLDIGDARWDAFLKTLKARDRLMHPKQENDLVITDAEFALASKTQNWFIENFTQCLSLINSSRTAASNE